MPPLLAKIETVLDYNFVRHDRLCLAMEGCSLYSPIMQKAIPLLTKRSCLSLRGLVWWKDNLPRRALIINPFAVLIGTLSVVWLHRHKTLNSLSTEETSPIRSNHELLTKRLTNWGAPRLVNPGQRIIGVSRFCMSQPRWTATSPDNHFTYSY